MPHNAIIVECEGGKIELSNYMLLTLYHSIIVSLRNGTSRVEKAYTFEHGVLGDREENWWMSYRYQLETFVDRLKGKMPQTWVTPQDSAANMEWIEKIYGKVCAYRLCQCYVANTPSIVVDWTRESSEIDLCTLLGRSLQEDYSARFKANTSSHTSRRFNWLSFYLFFLRYAIDFVEHG
jgi:hypothetical protein